MIKQMEIIGDSKVGILDGEADENDDAFMLVDLDVVFERFALWKRELPMIEPFYAVKCNTDRVLVRNLAALGAGFDCASREEIDIVMDMGVTADRIIYANPCKTRSFITHAKERNVTMMTFDNAEELVKVARLHPDAEMILRIAVSDPTATCPLNLKFGADPVKAAPQLLVQAKQLGVEVVGISFHVGSGCNDPTAYREALAHARNLMDIGEGLGFRMKILDLGGGYPGSPHHTSFESIAAVIRSAVDEFFPEGMGVRLIAEPGRFFAAAPFTLVCNVIHATEVSAEKITNKGYCRIPYRDLLTHNPSTNPILAEDSEHTGYMYYINDGVYGSFNCILFDHVQPEGIPLFVTEDSEHTGYMYYINDGVYGSFNCILFDHVQPEGIPLFDEIAEEYPTTIWGPTCDSLDKVEDKKHMRRLSVGDWIMYANMGAYTCSASTTFNGFQRPTPVYVISRENW
ncbi:Pyridoxal-dependent decarboxylase, pyridoxal binding domain protein [Ancylostoma duodenale]|uniref:ornithine decarboxylase n=1 Tax=Ancylostoma duodenale TaxID=51022 RepID=A0A0C2G9H5_9BILA|nr:Pyridoxal-dependent decarboxylase, pyridoxal binding domain protein [Ancylostoma duodenale]